MNAATLPNGANLESIEITPLENPSFDNKRFQKLSLDQAQKASIDQLLTQIPTMLAADMLKDAYVIRFPVGLPHTLMQYKSGGVGTPIMGEHGIIAHASLHKLTSQVVLLNAFSVMSIATGQYFLAEINKNFTKLNQKIDKVIDFLYGEKKSELISEVNFIQYAYKNFTSIMQHSEQRVATIVGLQSAKKVAMKDIDFYLSDLNKTALEDLKQQYSKLESTVADVCNARDTLELSLQLFVMSAFMETYYAENMDLEYLQAQKEDALTYVRNCERQILGIFNNLLGQCNQEYKINPLKTADTTELKARLQEVIRMFEGGEESQICKTIHAMWDNPFRGKEYYVTKEGNIYIAS